MKTTKKFKTWQQLKLEGSGHYKTGTVEPIDLYKSKGVFKPFALANIAKYSCRNMNEDRETFIKDMVKIIHYAELLIAEHKESQCQTKTR